MTHQHHEHVDAESNVNRYGTHECPLAIEQARARIREDFLRFAGLVMDNVQLPEGYVFSNSPALGPEHQLTWYLGCEVLSSDAGLSVFVHHQVRDDHDEFRLRVEARYFHPELHFRPTKLSPPKVSRRYNEGFSAHLWVEQGRPYWGMHKSLISGSEFCPSMPTHNALAAEVATRLNLAIQCRAMPKVGEVLAC